MDDPTFKLIHAGRIVLDLDVIFPCLWMFRFFGDSVELDTPQVGKKGRGLLDKHSDMWECIRWYEESWISMHSYIYA